MVPHPKLYSCALAGQKGVVSRNHVDADGVATVVENHFGQLYWFVMVGPKKSHMRSQKALFEKAYQRWFDEDWDVLVLNPSDVV